MEYTEAQLKKILKRSSKNELISTVLDLQRRLQATAKILDDVRNEAQTKEMENDSPE